MEVTGPGILDVTAWRQRSSMTVHLVNLTNPMMMKGPLREVLPVGAQRVRVRIPDGSRATHVRLLTAGTTLPVSIAAGVLTVTCRQSMSTKSWRLTWRESTRTLVILARMSDPCRFLAGLTRDLARHSPGGLLGFGPRRIHTDPTCAPIFNHSSEDSQPHVLRRADSGRGSRRRRANSSSPPKRIGAKAGEIASEPETTQPATGIGPSKSARSHTQIAGCSRQAAHRAGRR